MITREAELIQEHNSMSKTRTAGFNAPALRLAGKNKEQNFVCTKETWRYFGMGVIYTLKLEADEKGMNNQDKLEPTLGNWRTRKAKNF